jgi:predicted nucleotidyltransferase
MAVDDPNRVAGAKIFIMPIGAVPAASPHVNVAAIQGLLDRIVARWHPRQVWLFGSRARGDSTPDSDWDLFVVVDDSTDDNELDPGVGRRLRRECGVRADVIPWRVSEFTEFRNTPNTLAYSVTKDGVLLHER